MPRRGITARGRGIRLVATIVLICGVVVSLASGVLLAHGLCVSMFALFRIHASQVTAGRAPDSAGLEEIGGESAKALF